jgi:hypothetical protein
VENFNKNWLLILLVAVVFGTLGFLVGRTTGHGHGGHQQMMYRHNLKDTFDIKVDVDADDGEAIVKVDTIMKDGKQIIVKEVKRVKK